MQQQHSIYQTPEDKLRQRLQLSFEERFRGLMQMIRIRYKLQNAKIINKK